ncbi:MAG: YeeE/YedE family protein [Alcanivoracaceae bacterium]|nr:YeeE/YedE family protein [Alcanivoracaceae bacterium]
MQKHLVSALLVGLIFGLGLILGGMTNPAKVIGFLDLFGNWDPSLALVMGGAVVIGLVTFKIAGGRTTSLIGEPMRIPTNSDIDHRLVIGSLVFGAGWGMAGFCPGPALVAFGSGSLKATIFVAAMVAGMGLFEIIERARQKA